MGYPSPSLILKARAITKAFHYPRPLEILQGIHLDVESGQSVAIVGRSGEGKSTLLQILGTLDEPTHGEIWIDNQLVTSKNRSAIRNQQIGFVFQSFHLLEDYSALDNVLMPAWIARLPIVKNSPSYERALGLLDRVGLKNRKNFGTKYLSGGEKQRVALARALCNDPKIIFADEPSGNLDKETSKLIHQLLLEFSSQPGKALVLVTHDLELAGLCSRQYHLENGQLH